MLSFLSTETAEMKASEPFDMQRFKVCSSINGLDQTLEDLFVVVWIGTVIGFLASFVAISLLKRPQTALGLVIPAVWIVPVWAQVPTGIEALNIRTAVSIGSLILYCLLPKATFPWRFMPCDWAVIFLLAVHLASDSWHTGIQLATPAFAYVEWLLPYLCGRLAFQHRDDLDWAWKTLCLVGLLLAFAAFFEAWFRVNLFEVICGLRPEDRSGRNAVRWGIRRAYGPTMHPLYFGVILCWFVGWWIYAAWRFFTDRSPWIWLLGAAVGVLAPIATGSRGPVLGVLIVVLGFVFCFCKKFRVPASISILVIGFLAVGFQDSLLSHFDEWSGEAKLGRNQAKVVFDNESLIVSSARSRLLLFEIYWKALMQAGFLGFGTDAVSTFPVNVPLGRDEAEAIQRIWMVDNFYLLATLRFGYLGLSAILLVGGTSLWQLIRVRDSQSNSSLACLSAAVFGSVIGVLIMLWTVWMPGEIGFPLFWSFGLSSGLYRMISVRVKSKHAYFP